MSVLPAQPSQSSAAARQHGSAAAHVEWLARHGTIGLSSGHLGPGMLTLLVIQGRCARQVQPR